ncbi:hypothetical protein KKC91_00155 [bacterium]|nr:hypothetical protein [bacterium]
MKSKPLVDRLREYIDKGDITVMEAAIGTEVTVYTISNWRKERNYPRSLTTIKQLERYLNKLDKKFGMK